MTLTAMADQVEQRIAAALAEFGAPPEAITREASFESLDIDSLDLVELTQVVEAEYSVTIEDLSTLRTVGDAVDYVVTHGS